MCVCVCVCVCVANGGHAPWVIDSSKHSCFTALESVGNKEKMNYIFDQFSLCAETASTRSWSKVRSQRSTAQYTCEAKGSEGDGR